MCSGCGGGSHRGFSLWLFVLHHHGCARTQAPAGAPRKRQDGCCCCEIDSVPALAVCASAPRRAARQRLRVVTGLVLSVLASHAAACGRGKGGCGSGAAAAAVVPICVSAVLPCAAWRELVDLPGVRRGRELLSSSCSTQRAGVREDRGRGGSERLICARLRAG